MTRAGWCWHCGAEIEAAGFGRADHCACSYSTRCCRNCELYDTGRENQCREPQAERVVEKEAANFCEFFHPRAGKPGAARSADPADAARSALDALFKPKPSE